MVSSAGSDLLESFLGALQASLAVLLTIFYGVVAAQFNLIDAPAAKKISSVAVRLFLPALLITKVGSELHWDTGVRYVPVLIWSLVYTFVSMGLGLVTTKVFKLPTWVTPALCFNNTTSLPLLLIKALETTGILERITPDGDSVADAVKRAESYFLVCAIVGNCLTFALGPRLIDCEHAPEKKEEDDQPKDDDGDEHNGDVENGNNQQEHEEDQERATEESSLLPARLIRSERSFNSYFRISTRFHNFWHSLSPRTQKTLLFLSDFFNAPLVGALIGLVIGLAPPLHRAFFASSDKGGFLNAWLTSSLRNIGDLFASLQIVVVGVNLSSSLVKMKKGEAKEGSAVPWRPALYVILVRFFLWPVISIAIIYGLAVKTSVLNADPILWFTLMLIPTGPSAIKVLVMADVNGADEGEMMGISKFLTISYALSPLICFAVVASLKCTEIAMQQ